MAVFYIFAGMAFLFPVAAYLLFLAIINGRPHPTVISGPWDFAGILFATCGFWLLGGPLALTTFHARWRPALLHGETTEIASGDWSFLWIIPWVVYFTLVLLGAGWLLWRRRDWTVVYNITPRMMDDVLAGIFSRLGVTSERFGNRVLLQPAGAAFSESGSEAIQAVGDGAPPRTDTIKAPVDLKDGPAPLATLVVDTFPAMQHVSLHWREADPTLRRDVEAELTRRLVDVESLDNPAAGWLLTVSSCLFSAIFLGLVGFVFLVMRR